MTPSSHLRAFLDSVEGRDQRPFSRENAEAFDLVALGDWTAEEKEVAKALLLERLQSDTDPRIARALGWLGDASVVASLRGALGHHQDHAPTVLAILDALGELGSADDARAIVLPLVERSAPGRLQALLRVRRESWSGDDVLRALGAALSDGDDTVRFHAAEHLLHGPRGA